MSCCCCWVASVVSDSVPPHRRQPTRLPCPWDSPGKNTGVGCHCLLQCIKVKSESEVAQSCLTLSDPMDCSPPGPSVHGIFQARVLEWGAIAFSDSGWGWALNPVTGVLIRKWENTQRRKEWRVRTELQGRGPCEHGGRDWCDSATLQGTPGAPESGRGREDPPLGPSEEAWPCGHFDLRLLASRTGRWYISIVLSHSVFGTLS